MKIASRAIIASTRTPPTTLPAIAPVEIVKFLGDCVWHVTVGLVEFVVLELVVSITVHDPFRVSNQALFVPMMKLSEGPIAVNILLFGVFGPGAWARNRIPFPVC